MEKNILEILEKAQKMWDSFSDNEKTGVRFGMLPFHAIREAQTEGYNGRELTLAIMKCAEKDGGMVA